MTFLFRVFFLSLISFTGCGNEYQRQQSVQTKLSTASVAEIERACLGDEANSDFACAHAGLVYRQPEGNHGGPPIEVDLKKSLYFYGLACEKGRPWGCRNAARVAHMMAISEQGREAVFDDPPSNVVEFLKKSCKTPRYGMSAVACNDANSQAPYWNIDMGEFTKEETGTSPI